MKSNPPSVFIYTDYRRFLKDSYLFKKRQNRHFTFRHFSLETGYRSSGILKEIITGKRKIPQKKIRDFIKPFGLKEKEADYFEKLVLFNDAKDGLERDNYFRELLAMRCVKKTRMITFKDAAFYSDWINSAIRELITLKDFQEDPTWIAKKLSPHVTPVQVKKSLQLLLKLGLIKRDEKGKLVQDSPKLDVDPDLKLHTVKNFSRRTIELSWEAIERFSPEDREISGLTLGLSKDCYKKVREMVRKFQDEVLNYVCNDPSDSDMVCRLNTELFPMVKFMERSSKNEGKINEND